MNFFELFALPEQLNLDAAELKQKYLQLQQQYHPDQQASQQDANLEKSSEINHAYQTLLHIDSRAAYLLQLQKQDFGLEQSIHDFEFLQSALELREQLEEATTSEQLQNLRQEIAQWVDGLTREFQHDFNDQDWGEARDTVRKLRFFRHVLQDIDQAEDRLFDAEQYDLDDEF
ncbi:MULTISPECIES: Fe-S protein assembly co-chaperone HscB [unclassified Acinetobacter]|uniref:Fe-S protein assembly co-chaperone HscB n=1 Tax=unclassified Acinetobacter TaxID=196816 RepID=UPI0035BAEE63